jgi:hypothetical protein
VDTPTPTQGHPFHNDTDASRPTRHFDHQHLRYHAGKQMMQMWSASPTNKMPDMWTRHRQRDMSPHNTHLLHHCYRDAGCVTDQPSESGRQQGNGRELVGVVEGQQGNQGSGRERQGRVSAFALTHPLLLYFYVVFTMYINETRCIPVAGHIPVQPAMTWTHTRQISKLMYNSFGQFILKTLDTM